jgi:glycyl-tRNA synthetase
LSEVVDVELVKGEDSVTSLAVADSSGSALTAFAGINSSIADQTAGKNEHLRSFRIGLPAKKRRADGSGEDVKEKGSSPGPSSEALGRTALFKSAKGARNETYQRILRLSPAQRAGQPRLAAVATGLAPENEIVVFRSTPAPSPTDEVSRISLGSREAADLDLTVNEDGHLLAYCTDDQVFVQRLSTSTQPNPPVSLYRTSESTTSLPASKRPKFRAIRFLTPRYLLLLQNRPGRTGADLLLLRVATDLSQARISLRKRLNSSIKAAVGLEVCPLTASEQGDRQIVVAVAGQSGDDSSIELLTVDHSTVIGGFRPYTLLRGVHQGPLTKLVFSNFVGPSLPVTKETPPQSVRLGSVGVDQFVLVHHLPLRPFPPQHTQSPRYVLVPPGRRSEAVQTTFSVFFALVVVGVVALLMQAFCEIRGAVPPTLGASDWLTPRMREVVARPYIFADAATDALSSVVVAASDVPVAAHGATDRLKDAASQIPAGAQDVREYVSEAAGALTRTLRDLVEENAGLETPQAIIVRDHGGGEISTELAHDDAASIRTDTLRRWDELGEAQRHGWRRRLVEAGRWTEQQGEAVLKGILFSQLAGAVGDMAG